MEEHRHRALGDPRRARIVEALERAPLDAHELSRRLSLHVSTVRFHLGVLASAGLVASAPELRGGRGRPRIVYRLADTRTAGDEYRFLAGILSGLVAGDAAERAGREWGRDLASHRAGDAVEAVVAILEEEGFSPQRHHLEVHMHRCPFADVARRHPQVVCRLHKGVVEGALAALGSQLAVEKLDVFVEPSLCVAHLAARA